MFYSHFTMARATKIAMFGTPTCTHNASMTPIYATMIPRTKYTMVPSTKYTMVPGTKYRYQVPNIVISYAREALWTLTLASGMLTSAAGDPKNRGFCYHGHNMATYH